MTLTEMYSIADAENIAVYDFPINGFISISVPKIIAIDTEQIKTQRQEKEALSHEIGHCVTGSFYNTYSEYDIRAKHELKADRWAIKKLIPKDELDEAIGCGYIECWELAEHFDVDCEFMIKAIEFYKRDTK